MKYKWPRPNKKFFELLLKSLKSGNIDLRSYAQYSFDEVYPYRGAEKEIKEVYYNLVYNKFKDIIKLQGNYVKIDKNFKPELSSFTIETIDSLYLHSLIQVLEHALNTKYLTKSDFKFIVARYIIQQMQAKDFYYLSSVNRDVDDFIIQYNKYISSKKTPAVMKDEINKYVNKLKVKERY